MTAPQPITRATCWSVRQCTERAAQLLQRSEDAVAELDALLDDTFGVTPRCPEHQAVVTQLDHLHTLVEHLLANLRFGFAAPLTPTIEPKPATPPAPPPPAAVIAATKPRGIAGRTTANTSRADVIAAARAEGLLDMTALAHGSGYSKLTIQQYRSEGRLPKEHTMRHGVPFWKPEQVAHIKHRRVAQQASA